MTRSRWPVVLLIVCACDLAPLNVTGLLCNEERGCGDGFECIDGQCVEFGTFDAGMDEVDAGMTIDAGPVDAGPVDAGRPDSGVPRGVNLVANAGFESLTSDGGVSSWRASTGRLVTSDGGRNGIRSARVQSSAFQQNPVLIPNSDVEGAELGMLFCGSLWVRSDSDAGIDVTLTIRDRFFDGGSATSSGTRLTVRTNWVQLKEEYASIGVSTIQLRLTANSRFDAGDGFFVDDAWLSRADFGGCPP